MRSRPEKCKRCGLTGSVDLPISFRGYCPLCASVRQIDAINSIKTRRGAQYDRWVAGIVAAAAKHAGDFETLEDTIPPAPIGSPGDSDRDLESLD